jgi:hypothetical protein
LPHVFLEELAAFECDDLDVCVHTTRLIREELPDTQVIVLTTYRCAPAAVESRSAARSARVSPSFERRMVSRASS